MKSRALTAVAIAIVGGGAAVLAVRSPRMPEIGCYEMTPDAGPCLAFMADGGTRYLELHRLYLKTRAAGPACRKVACP